MAICGKRIGKKGSLLDILYIGVILLVFSVVLLIGFKLQSGINTKVQAMALMPAEATSASSKLTGVFTGTFDNVFLFLTIGLAIAALVLAALVRVHPIFIPIFFIALVMVIFFAGVMSNIYQTMASNPAMIAEANQLVMISHILTYLPFIIGIFGIVLMIVMYKLWQTSQEI